MRELLAALVISILASLAFAVAGTGLAYALDKGDCHDNGGTFTLTSTTWTCHY